MRRMSAHGRCEALLPARERHEGRVLSAHGRAKALAAQHASLEVPR